MNLLSRLLLFALSACALLIPALQALAETPTPAPDDIGWFSDGSELKPSPGERIPLLVRHVLLEGDATRIFQQLSQDPEIPFQYPDDGCYARAQRMAKLLEERGIDVSKIFIEGDLKVKTPNNPTGEVNWWYHVAPVVYVRTAFGDLPMVFDPSLFDKPVPIHDWVEIQTRHNAHQEIRLYFRSRFTYEPGPEKDAWSEADMQNAKEVMARYLIIQIRRAKHRIN